MPDSPAMNAGKIPSIEILINGSLIKDFYNPVSIDVTRAVSRIGSATLVFSLTQDTLDSDESNDFVSGSILEIRAGYDADSTSLFKGVIVLQGMRSGDDNSLEMIVQCSDEAIKLTLGRQRQYFQEMTDSDVISRIVGACSPLSCDVKTTDYTHPQLIQYECSDWDFVLSRAAANGLLVYTDGAKVIARAPGYSDAAVLTLELGLDVIHFDFALDTRAQIAGSNSKASMSAMRGTLKTMGSAKAQLNALVSLKEFGNCFKGDALVTSIQQVICAGEWFTTFGFGLPADQETALALVGAPAAGGSAVYGLQHGTVKQMDQDPAGEYRILVEVPVFGAPGEGIWARLAQFYASADAGSFFLPEPGDEVILGFLNDDPRYPVILGMMYSKKNKPPYTPDPQNKIKGIVTRNKLSLSFDDTDKVLTIQTPGGNEFCLSDRDKSIRLKDQNGHSLLMDSSGITLESMKDLAIKAKGKIEMKAVGGISATAIGDIQLEGLNVKASAQVAFLAQGQATAELKSSGQTVVKGAIVMIN